MRSTQKICMIGPSYPFRGGIAHYTTLLYRALREQYDMRFYAFERQYPRWLYPGRSDRDPSGLAMKEDDIECLLDSLNPLTWLDVARRIRTDAPDLLIVPWWVSFWTPQFWSILRLVRRVPSIPVLMICHNVISHESTAWDRLCTRLVLRNADYFLVHSDEDADHLREMVPGARVRKVLHPTYKVFDCRRLTKAEAQARLGLSGRVLLFFGFVRPYKGLEYLLAAMPAIVKQTDAHLLIAGEFWRDKGRYLRQIRTLGIESRVAIVDRYIPNEDVSTYFSAADAVVLPYVGATQSGIAQIAYAFDKPVVVTRVGGLPDAVEDGKTGFVVEAGNPEAIAEAVHALYDPARHAEIAANIARRKEQFSWQRIVEAISEFMHIPASAPIPADGTTLLTSENR